MDTMDFVKRAWANLDLSSPFTPTLSLEEMDTADLDVVDPEYPVILGVRATRAP